jgi:hypothetical protein
LKNVYAVSMRLTGYFCPASRMNTALPKQISNQNHRGAARRIIKAAQRQSHSVIRTHLKLPHDNSPHPP